MIKTSMIESNTWDFGESKVEREKRMFVDDLLLDEQPFEIVECEFGKQIVKIFLLVDKLEELEEKSSNSVPGFMIDKCLRKVRTENESRDIYSAVKCEFDRSFKMVVNYYPEEKFVIKRVSKNRSPKITNFLRREFKVQAALSQMNHPGFNPLASYHESATSLFAVSFSAGNCDLLDFLQDHIEKTGSSFSEDLVRKLFVPVIEALALAHKVGIAHRDISLENLVVDSGKSMQVIDWGHAVSSKRADIEYKGPVGKERYFAPELLFREDEEFDLYNPFKADVFSLGVCLFSALTGQMPFSSLEDDRAACLRVSARNLISRLPKNSVQLSELAIDLLDSCLKWDFKSRASMQELLQHKFFVV